MQTNCSFSCAAVSASSNDSCAITWHQWQAAYPTDNSTGTSRARAAANASGVQGHQSTGLSLCCCKYGLVAVASRLDMSPSSVIAVRVEPRPYELDGRSVLA